MWIQNRKWRAGAVRLFGGLAIVVCGISASAQEKRAERETDTAKYLEAVADLAGRQSGLSEYWVGVDGVQADDVLRAQLELPVGQGVVVNQVVDDSPAAKAGLKQYDVLLAADDKPLVELSDLAKLIQQKKEQPLSVKLVRAGKRITIEVTPARRPAIQTGETCPQISKLDDAGFAQRLWLDLAGAAAADEDVKRFMDDKKTDKRSQLANWLLRKSTVTTKSCTSCHSDHAESAKLVDRLLLMTDLDHQRLRLPFWEFGLDRLSVAYPGVAVPGEAVQELPDDVTITITRHGKQPALVVVQKGKDSWNAEAGELDKLPQEVRGSVEHWLGLGLKAAATDRDLTVELASPKGALKIGRVHIGVPLEELFLGRTLRLTIPPAAAEPEKPAAALERFEKELGELNGRLDELRKSMKELQSRLQEPESKPEDKQK